MNRILEIVCDSPAASEPILDAIAADELTSSLLVLHGLHPDDGATRARRALEKLNGSLQRRGAGVSLLSVEEEVARVRFDSVRPWSGGSVRALIEEAVYGAAPELHGVVVEGLPDSPDFVPLSSLLIGRRV